MKQTHNNLDVTVLNDSQHRRTCNYWFVVTSGASPHTAFETKAGLLEWMMERGLCLSKALTKAGTWSTQRIHGSYRTESHYGDDSVAEFDAITAYIDTRTLSNGDYVEAKITIDPDGIRTVHTLNPNVHTRHVYDYAESSAMMR